MIIWTSIKRGLVKDQMHKRKEERNKPERRRLFLKKHKLSEDLKQKYLINKDSNKRFK